MQLRLTDRPINDVRIVQPFNELKEFAMSIKLDELEDKMHAHIPYVILLIQALEVFKANNNNKLPSTKSEKEEFKAILKKWDRTDEDKKFYEDNFKEALNFHYEAHQSKLNLIPDDEEGLTFAFKLFEENSLEDLMRRSNNIMSTFFVIIKAIKIFYERYKTLPVVGNISDMTSDTETYIKLKRIYEKKGKEDRDLLREIVKEVVGKIDGSDLVLKKEQVIVLLSNNDINYLDIVSKNYFQMTLFHFSTIEEEDNGTNFQSIETYEPAQKICFIWYLLIKAADLFYEKNNRYPGEHIDHTKFQNDIPLLVDCLNAYLENKGKKQLLPFELSEITENYIHEFCRMSNSKIPSAISIIGSLASQEIIKLITYTFRTINNTVIFDGIHSFVNVLKL